MIHPQSSALRRPGTRNRPTIGQRLAAGFSLVEVALAVGIVGFGMTVILGCLPVGLLSVKDSKIQSAKANIARQLRGELQQISFFADANSNANIDSLANKEYFYTLEGMRAPSAKEAYYRASFSVNKAAVTAAGDGGTSFLPDSARAVEVNLSYPQAAPENNREKAKFSLFLARQRGQ